MKEHLPAWLCLDAFLGRLEVLVWPYHPDVLRTDGFPRTKTSWMHKLPNFVTHGAPLCARELRYQ